MIALIDYFHDLFNYRVAFPDRKGDETPMTVVSELADEEIQEHATVEKEKWTLDFLTVFYIPSIQGESNLVILRGIR